VAADWLSCAFDAMSEEEKIFMPQTLKILYFSCARMPRIGLVLTCGHRQASCRIINYRWQHCPYSPPMSWKRRLFGETQTMPSS